MRTHWTYKLATGLLALSLTLAGCSGAGSGGDSSKPIKIGAFFDVTGGASSLGKSEADTATLVVDQINAKGGIKGRKVELIMIDTKSQETEANLAAKKLIDEGVVAIVGGSTSGATLAAVPVIEKEGVPFISLGAAAAITRPVKQWVFKTPQTDEHALQKIFEYLKANKLTKVAWISSNNAYGDTGKAEFDRMAPGAGLEVVAVERYNLDDKDMTAQLTRIKGKNPQAIINWSIPPAASIVTNNFKQLGFTNTVFIQNHGVANPSFLEQTKGNSDGVILPAGPLAVIGEISSSPRKQLIETYLADFKKRFGYDASAFGGYAYDGFHIVFKAVEAVGDDRAKVRDYIEGLKNHVGVTGTFSFSKEDHVGLVHNDSFELIEVKGGKFTLYKK